MGITLTMDRSELESRFGRLIGRLDDFEEGYEAIAQVLENSIRRNFMEGGRPEQWKQSQRARADHGQTLRDTDRLMNSIVGVGLATAAKAGTNVAYAAAHNFGVDEEITQQVREHVRRITKAFGKEIPLTEVRVKPHSRKMHLHLQQREFMVIQEEDWTDIREIIEATVLQAFEE